MLLAVVESNNNACNNKKGGKIDSSANNPGIIQVQEVHIQHPACPATQVV